VWPMFQTIVLIFFFFFKAKLSKIIMKLANNIRE